MFYLETLEDRVCPAIASNYVQALYQQFLHRTASPQDLVFWDSQLAQQGSQSVAAQISHSPEAFQATVTDLYFKIMQRAPDAAGLQFWTSTLAAGATLESVETAFYTSREFAFFHAVGVDFVDRIYIDELHRVPSLQEEEFWHFASEQQVANAVFSSTEFKTIQINSDYETFLDRQPSNVEVGFWLNTGFDTQTLASQIGGSAESLVVNT